LEDLPDWNATLLHTKPLGFRPAIPRSVRDRVRVKAVRATQQRAEALRGAAIFVPAPGGEKRLALEAAAAGAAVVEGPEEAEKLARDARLRGPAQACARRG